MRKVLCAVTMTGAALALPLGGGAAQASVTDTLRACLRYEGRAYEVCTAYVGNSSLLALVPYYKWANSSNPARAVAVTNRLRSRYYGAARRLIAGRVNGWPAGENKVSIPLFTILSVSSDLEHNRAILRTRETWRVRTKSNGRTIYREIGRPHRITMKRVQGLVLHKWVVSAIR